MADDVESLVSGGDGLESWAEGATGPDGLTRREVLSYAWLASLGVMGAGLATLLYKMARPNIQPFFSAKLLDAGLVEALPGVGAAPLVLRSAQGSCWWVATDAGALALSRICTHLPCIYGWKPEERKFICPCHGQMYTRDGTFISGPADRDADRLVIHAYGGRNEVARTDPSGRPLRIPAGSRVLIDLGDVVRGSPYEPRGRSAVGG